MALHPPTPPPPFPITPVPLFFVLTMSQGKNQCLQPCLLLPFQALDAIEKAQDLAEEVGNKVRHDYASWAWLGSRAKGRKLGVLAHACDPPTGVEETGVQGSQ